MYTIKDRANDLRKDLKNNLGYTTKQVSVKMSAGIAIEVTIKDYTVDYNEVEKIAKKYESVDWDEHTGEILEGSNIFIEVNNEAINPAYEEMGKVVFETIEDNKYKEIDKKIAFVNDKIIIHLIDIDKRIPKFMIELDNKKTRFKDLYSIEQIAKQLTLLK